MERAYLGAGLTGEQAARAAGSVYMDRMQRRQSMEQMQQARLPSYRSRRHSG